MMFIASVHLQNIKPSTVSNIKLSNAQHPAKFTLLSIQKMGSNEYITYLILTIFYGGHTGLPCLQEGDGHEILSKEMLNHVNNYQTPNHRGSCAHIDISRIRVRNVKSTLL